MQAPRAKSTVPSACGLSQPTASTAVSWQNRRVPLVTVVIPTRNRPSLAAAAVRSVLDTGVDSVRVVVSDNSTDLGHRDELERSCAALPRERVRYLRPEAPLAMTAHWEWALDHAIAATPGATHVAYLTDRMLFRRGMLRAVLEAVARYPEQVVTYNHDRVDDTSRPVVLYRCASTGRLYEVRAEHLLELYSRVVLTSAVPRMLNSVVPTLVVEAVRQRFGTVFDSASPDFCFAFRCLEVVDQILFFDQAALIHRALDRSNGQSVARGVPSEDGLDYVRGLGESNRNSAAPIPEFETLTNAIVHEYCLARDEARTERFPEIDRSCYLAAIADDVKRMENPDLAARTLAQLKAHGWAPEAAASRRTGPPLLRRVAERVRRSAPVSTASRWTWRALSRADIRPPASVAFRFRSTEAALEYEQSVGTRRAAAPSPRELLQGARIVDTA